ncbi:hypothetical protein D3C75_817250 [compost metagenome]
MADLSYFLDRLDRTRFVIRVHDGDQNGLVRELLFHIVNLHHSIRVNRYISQVVSHLLQVLTRFNYRWMLNSRQDNVITFMAIRLGYSFNDSIIRLTTPTGKKHLTRRTIQEISHLCSCLLYSEFSFPPQRMTA